MSDWAFDLGFPEDYLRLPVQLLDGESPEGAVDAGDAALLEEIRARLADEDPRLIATPEELLPLLWEFTLEAGAAGAIQAAVQVLDLPDGRYTAVARVFLKELAGRAAEAPGHVETLAAQLREPRHGDVTSRTAEVVTMAGRPAVRVSYRADDEGGAQAPGTVSVVLEVLEHWFPVDGLPWALVVEGRTSCLADADSMVDDLDRIAASVRLYPA